MEKVASNIASRLWTFVSQYPIGGRLLPFPGISNEIKNISKLRIRLLNNLSMMERDVIDIEALLGGWDETSIASAFYRFSKFTNLFNDLFVKNFNHFNSKLNRVVEQIPLSPGEKSPEEIKDNSFIGYFMNFYGKDGLYPDILQNLKKQEISTALKSFIKKMNKFPEDSIDREMVKDIILYNRMENPELIEHKGLFLKQIDDDPANILNLYNRVENPDKNDPAPLRKDIGFVSIILGILNEQDKNTEEAARLWQSVFDDDDDLSNKYNILLNEINKLADMKLSSFEEIADALSKTKVSELHPLLEKIARKRLHRFLNKLRLNVSRNLESKRILEITEKLNYLSKVMDYTQDHLEIKEFDYEAIRNNVSIIYLKIGELCDEFSNIAKDYNDQVGEHNINEKKKMSLVRTTDIFLLKRKSEYFINLYGELNG